MSQQEHQQMDDGHSGTMEGELTVLWSSRLTVGACVCARARVNHSGQSVTGTSKSACFEKHTLACSIDSGICAEKFPSLIWFCLSRKKKKNWEERGETFESWRASDWRMSHPDWLRCRMSAVSESPCSSDRGGRGWVEREAEGGGKQRKLGGWKKDGGGPTSSFPTTFDSVRGCFGAHLQPLWCLPIHHHVMWRSHTHTGCCTCLWSHTLQSQEAKKQLTTKPMLVWRN